jgi:hypothetical protein
VGGFHAGDEAPLEAGNEALFEAGDFLRGAVAGEDDLLAGVVERVEGVEELLLGALLVGQVVDVVDQEEVDVAVAVAEGLEVALLDGGDEVVGEGFAAQVEDRAVRVAAERLVGDGLEEVRLAEPHGAVEEQRVERVAGGLRHREGRGLRQAVGGADHEMLKGVIRVEGDFFHF